MVRLPSERTEAYRRIDEIEISAEEMQQARTFLSQIVKLPVPPDDDFCPLRVGQAARLMAWFAKWKETEPEQES